MHAASDRTRTDSASQSGYTLVEMLLVVLVLSVVAAIVVFSVTGLTFGTATASCVSDYKTVEHAELSYEAQVGTYAATVADLQRAVTLADGSQVGPWLSDSVGNARYYSIGIDDGSIAGGTRGEITVSSVDPSHSAQDGDENCTYA
jgi:prepilin-type N-terminal cleavage/methylation domain-containing protein